MTFALTQSTFHEKLNQYVKTCDESSTIGGRLVAWFTKTNNAEERSQAETITSLLEQHQAFITQSTLPKIRTIIDHTMRIGCQQLAQKLQAIYDKQYDWEVEWLLKEKITKGDQEGAFAIVKQVAKLNDFANQFSFWCSIEPKAFKTLSKLFEGNNRAIEGVKNLLFSDSQSDLWDPETSYVELMQFQADMITACKSDLQEVRFTSPRIGTFHAPLLAAFMKCEQLHTVDISHFCLYNPQEVLTSLSFHPTLKKLHIQIPFALLPKLLDLPEKLYQLLATVHIDYEELQYVPNGAWANRKNERQSGSIEYFPTLLEQQAIKNFFEKCPNIRAVRGPSANLLSVIPKTIDSLELLLPAENFENSVLAPALKIAPKWKKARQLTIYPAANSDVHLDSALNLIKQFSKLQSLDIGNLSCIKRRSITKLLSHLVDTCPTIRTLSCQLQPTSEDKQLAQKLASRLKTVELNLLDSQSDNEYFIGECNPHSRVERLKLTVQTDKTDPIFARIVPLLNALNPEELFLGNLYDSTGNRVRIDVEITSSGNQRHIELINQENDKDRLLLDTSRFTRLKRLVFDEDAKTAWREGIYDLLTPLYVPAPFGKHRVNDIIDLRDV